jgi:hypothetical protein
MDKVEVVFKDKRWAIFWCTEQISVNDIDHIKVGDEIYIKQQDIWED